MDDEEHPIDLLAQLVADVSKALEADGAWDAFRVEVVKEGLKVAVSVGWSDDDEEEDE